MIQICVKCKHLLCEGDKVTVQVTATYHVLKSKIAYALDKSDLECDSDTLGHLECPKGD